MQSHYLLSLLSFFSLFFQYFPIRMQDRSLSPTQPLSSSKSSQERYLADSRPWHHKLVSLFMKRRAFKQITLVLLSVVFVFSTCLFFFHQHTRSSTSASATTKPSQWIKASPPPPSSYSVSQFSTWQQGMAIVRMLNKHMLKIKFRWWVDTGW